MSGTPTEAELQTQWRNWIDIIEKTRVYADSVAGAGNEFDVLLQSLEGEFTPLALAGAVANVRAGLSELVDPGTVLDGLTSIVFEYGQIMAPGAGYDDLGNLMRALYEHFVINTLTVESRAITYDTTATTSNGFGGAIIGDGTMTRLTVDENNFNLEACDVEAKRFRCRGDENTGTKKHAELFEHLGANASFDNLLQASFGSGPDANTFISCKHAGSAEGGSLLQNSSFTDFDNAATPKFPGWDLTGTAANLGQDTTTTFRGSPGTAAADDASMELTGSAGATLTLKQTLPNMQFNDLNPDTPYFFRVMFNADDGTDAAGGSINIRVGSATATATIASLIGNAWVELGMALDQTAWPRQFNEATFDVEIEWAGGTAGTLLVDDAIFVPYDLIDGTYWILIGGTTPFLLDDTLLFTDTGGAPATAKVQYWLYRSGLGYLPSTTGTPTFTEP